MRRATIRHYRRIWAAYGMPPAALIGLALAIFAFFRIMAIYDP